MVTAEYREKILNEYIEAAKVFTELMNEDGCTSTNFILFKQLSDINETLKGINDKLDGIDDSIRLLTIEGINTYKK